MHKRNVTDKLDALKRFKRLIKKKEEDNTELDGRLEDLSLSVAERRNVSETNGMFDRSQHLLCYFRNHRGT